MVLRRISISLLILTFFGLTLNNISEIRKSLFDQIHEIVFHGNGGYDYNTIYNMPIWLRNFTFKKLKEWYDQSSNKNQNNENTWVQGSIKEEALKNKQIKVPTYVTKASKK
jgi:hypothetical protein